MDASAAAISTVPVVTQAELEAEVAQLMVSALNLEVKASDIAPDTQLYGDGLGLDSIDILELALAVSKKYGFQMRSDDAKNQEIFTNVRSLSQHIAQERTK